MIRSLKSTTINLKFLAATFLAVASFGVGIDSAFAQTAEAPVPDVYTSEDAAPADSLDLSSDTGDLATMDGIEDVSGSSTSVLPSVGFENAKDVPEPTMIVSLLGFGVAAVAAKHKLKQSADT